MENVEPRRIIEIFGNFCYGPEICKATCLGSFQPKQAEMQFLKSMTFFSPTNFLFTYEVIDEYIHGYFSKLGAMKESQVLTEREKSGRREILEGVKNKGWMIYNSDKSGKIVLNTVENFLHGME